jgi:hypothetical protein
MPELCNTTRIPIAWELNLPPVNAITLPKGWISVSSCESSWFWGIFFSNFKLCNQTEDRRTSSLNNCPISMSMWNCVAMAGESTWNKTKVVSVAPWLGCILTVQPTSDGGARASAVNWGVSIHHWVKLITFVHVQHLHHLRKVLVNEVSFTQWLMKTIPSSYSSPVIGFTPKKSSSTHHTILVQLISMYKLCRPECVSSN